MRLDDLEGIGRLEPLAASDGVQLVRRRAEVGEGGAQLCPLRCARRVREVRLVVWLRGDSRF
jgi:hypothetical protein